MSKKDLQLVPAEETTQEATINNEVMYTDDGNNLRVMLTKTPMSYCSMVATTFDEKKLLFNAMNSPQKRVSEMINMTINVRDIFAESCQFMDENTGTLTPGMRIVFIDTDGVSYACASQGIYSAIKKLINIFGEPTWKDGLPVKVKSISKAANRNILTLEF